MSSGRPDAVAGTPPLPLTDSSGVPGWPELRETLRARRGHDFYPPRDLASSIPPLGGTDGRPFHEKTIHLHYFAGGSDWWLAEYDPTTGDGLGYVNHGDGGDAEWGYVYLPDLERLVAQDGALIVERDLDWVPKPAAVADLPGSPPLARAPRGQSSAASARDGSGRSSRSGRSGSDPFSVFTPAERIVIRHATEDWAASFYHRVGPFLFDRAGAARCVAEGCLKRLGQYPLERLCAAVSAHLDERPEILDRRLTNRERVQRWHDRDARAAELADAANARMGEGDPDRALALVSEAETASPEYRVEGLTWDDLREIIRRPASAAETGSDPGEAGRASRIAVFESWAATARTAGPLGMRSHVPDEPPRSVTMEQAEDLFSRMIDQAKRTDGAIGRLSWNGVHISVGASHGPESQRLRIAVGNRRSHLDIPLREAWPSVSERPALLRRIVNYIDGASGQAARLRQDVTRPPPSKWRTGCGTGITTPPQAGARASAPRR